MRPSAMHSNKTRPISGPCDNSSTGAVMHVVFPHHCPCICPMTQESVTCTSNHTHLSDYETLQHDHLHDDDDES